MHSIIMMFVEVSLSNALDIQNKDYFAAVIFSHLRQPEFES